MNEKDLLREMQTDLQGSPLRKVIYLEGKSDIPIFFALLGATVPRDNIHEGVLVRGLRDVSGGGGEAVRTRTALAARAGYRGVFGITDGDGESRLALAKVFDAPYSGPCFTWKAYCIESLLVKACWPAGWGDPPDLQEAWIAHTPYVALNRLHRRLQRSLQTLRLARFSHPTLEEPLRTREETIAALAKDKHLLAGYDVEAEFNTESLAVETAIRADVEEGYALVNGKWMVDVFAPRRLGAPWNKQTCRERWIEAVARAGGLPEAHLLWQRLRASR